RPRQAQDRGGAADPLPRPARGDRAAAQRHHRDAARGRRGTVITPPPHTALGRAEAAVSAAGMRLQPHDVEAEKSVLGAIMLDQNAVATVRDMLEPADFYVERHAPLYPAAVQ